MIKESVNVGGSGNYLRIAGKHTNLLKVNFHELKVKTAWLCSFL